MASLNVTPQETYDAMVTNRGSMRAVSRQLGISRGAVKYRLDKAAQMGLVYDKPVSGGKLKAEAAKPMKLPKKGELKRYIITSAQNNTDVFTAFFENLVTYAEHVDATLLVGTFSYNRNAFSQSSTKRGRGPTADDRGDNWYDPIVLPYISDDPLELAPMLEWRGEMNVLPTASRPLSGLQTYTQRRSAIFPHAKIALESIAGTADDGAKMNYTTGAVTMLNYVQKKAGLTAEFHHTYGAAIVEVDHEGVWHVRQLNADGDGSFYDIPNLGETGACFIHEGTVTAGINIEAANWGDLHPEVIDLEIKAVASKVESLTR